MMITDVYHNAAMRILDGDGVKLRSGAQVASRDIVQFVP
jgi:hypothetical protein